MQPYAFGRPYMPSSSSSSSRSSSSGGGDGGGGGDGDGVQLITESKFYVPFDIDLAVTVKTKNKKI